MKRIFLIRHAKSDWSQAGLDDHDRPLSPRGLRDGPFMASKLSADYDQLSMICTSSAVRAKRTAEYFKEAFDIPDGQYSEHDVLYLCDEDTLLSFIRTLPNDADSVAIVGHNPSWTWFVNLMTGVHIDNVPTCGISVLNAGHIEWKHFDLSQCKLEQFYYPKKYKRS